MLYDGHHVRSNYYIASKGHGCQFCSRSDEPGKRFENFYGAIASSRQVVTECHTDPKQTAFKEECKLMVIDGYRLSGSTFDDN